MIFSSWEVSDIFVSYKRQLCLKCTPDKLVMIVVLYIEVYVIDKTWSEYEPNQTTDYVVNLGLIMTKTIVNNGCFSIVTYTK